MEAEGIATITVGTGLKASQEAVALADKHGHLFATVGIHPTDADEAFDESAFEALLGPKVVAVGECGLDYFRGMRDGGQEDPAYKERQRKLFIQQIEFARKHDLPLMLHCRASKGTQDAYEEALGILAGYPGLKGNFHFFAGDLAVAKRAVAAGFTLSFDGPITFTEDYDEVIRFVPGPLPRLSRIVASATSLPMWCTS
jgi:TatD DNase family protein